MADTHSITNFIDAFYGGSRANRFVVQTETDPGPLSSLPSVGSPVGTGAATKQSAQVFRDVRSPAYTSSSQGSFPIHIRATKTPEMTMGVIPVNYRGKTVLFPGDRQAANWEIMVMDDVSTGSKTDSSKKNHHLHRAFIEWSRAISPTDGRVGVYNIEDATAFTSDMRNGNIWRVTQLNHADVSNNPGVNRNFRLFNCWPKEVGPLQLDMSVDNNINYFRVVMAFTHMQDYDRSVSSGGDW